MNASISFLPRALKLNFDLLHKNLKQIETRINLCYFVPN